MGFPYVRGIFVYIEDFSMYVPFPYPRSMQRGGSQHRMFIYLALPFFLSFLSFLFFD